jgi:hypothetical protein
MVDGLITTFGGLHLTGALLVSGPPLAAHSGPARRALSSGRATEVPPSC